MPFFQFVHRYSFDAITRDCVWIQNPIESMAKVLSAECSLYVFFTGCDYSTLWKQFQLALLRIQAISKIHKFTYHIVIKNMCSNDKRPSFISIFLFFLSPARTLSVCMHEYVKLFLHFSSWSFRFFLCPLSIWTENEWKKIVTNVQIGRIIFALYFSYLLS